MNQLIIEKLKILEKNATGFRKDAFKKAINVISTLKKDLKEDEYDSLPGIGKGIQKRIHEIFQRGTLEEADTLKETVSLEEEKDQILEDLSSVWSIGINKARELYNAGVRGISDLKKRKYSNFLTENQKIGLLYYRDFKERIPWSLADDFVQEVYLLFNDFDLFIEACGSYRRGKNTVGDIDFVIGTDDFTLKEIVDYLTEKEIIVKVLSLGKFKMLGVTQLSNGQYFRIDIILSSMKELPFALFYFTGPKDFVTRQRSVARRKGLTLNEFGFFDENGGRPKEEFTSEEDIFDFLDMPYQEPKDRF